MELILGGRYLPMSVLGKGGFGTAFLARDFDSPTKRNCVVKLFQPPVTLTATQMATAQRLFGTEAEVLERLGLLHPQIPNLYAYFPLLITNPLTNQTEELFYLVQEFVDGEDLEKVLERDGKFSEAAVTEVLREMLGVLDFVHNKGAIHRDVKPSNIMKGRDGRLSLLDFGAVKEVTAPSGVQRGPTTICSPDYAPPEQIMNGVVDPSSDLYALAATCVVLLTNMSSSELRDSSTNSWRWHSHTQVSAPLSQVLDKMLMARPSDRYPTAKAVLSALPSPGKTIGWPPPLLPTPTPKPVPKPVPPQTQAAPSPPMPLMQFLSSAAFLGSEAGLLAIATFSLATAGTVLVGGGVWIAMIAMLTFLQLRRVIEGWDFLIIAGLTLVAVVLFAPLNSLLNGNLLTILVIAVVSAGVAVAIAVLFRLIFGLVSRIM